MNIAIAAMWTIGVTTLYFALNLLGWRTTAFIIGLSVVFGLPVGLIFGE